jgi:hypothetical protein
MRSFAKLSLVLCVVPAKALTLWIDGASAISKLYH